MTEELTNRQIALQAAVALCAGVSEGRTSVARAAAEEFLVWLEGKNDPKKVCGETPNKAQQFTAVTKGIFTRIGPCMLPPGHIPENEHESAQYPKDPLQTDGFPLRTVKWTTSRKEPEDEKPDENPVSVVEAPEDKN